MSLWPLSSDKSQLFVAGRTLADWENDTGKTYAPLYPWELLDLNNDLMETIVNWPAHSGLQLGDNARVIIGKGTRILPGVYIEGSVIIGENCKIGPNCYLRGSTSIGDNCFVGQAVEVKNSILAPGVFVSHLSYVGDSYLDQGTNFGAGTITSNFRHDGADHRSIVAGSLIDTGRDKLGVIVGAGVHTGINTSIYPGRKIGAGATTLPGQIVSHDIPQASE